MDCRFGLGLGGGVGVVGVGCLLVAAQGGGWACVEDIENYSTWKINGQHGRFHILNSRYCGSMVMGH